MEGRQKGLMFEVEDDDTGDGCRGLAEGRVERGDASLGICVLLTCVKQAFLKAFVMDNIP